MSTVTPVSRTVPIPRRSPIARFIVRRPIAAFLIGAYVVGLPLLTIFTTASSLPSFVTTAVGLTFTYVALLGSALTVTWVIGGRGGRSQVQREVSSVALRCDPMALHRPRATRADHQASPH